LGGGGCCAKNKRTKIYVSLWAAQKADITKSGLKFAMNCFFNAKHGDFPSFARDVHFRVIITVFWKEPGSN